jgi:hypothetical protein
VLSVNCVHILASSHEKKLMTCRLAENRIISNYFNMAVYANYEFVANTTQKVKKRGLRGSYPLASEYERGRVSYSPSYPMCSSCFYFFEVYY